ncbi:MAG: hypothetical protein RIK87_17220 [Fuerstiella sp.]
MQSTALTESVFVFRSVNSVGTGRTAAVARSATLKIAMVMLLSAASAVTATAQSAGTSPVYQTHPGENSISIYEKFTTILEHGARIKKVLDFDADVIQIDPVQGHPNQVTVYALKTGITTVTLIDEFDQFTKVEVLVRGDVRHLESYLRKFYPNDAINIEEIKGSILLSGWVTRPEHINEIVAIAEQFYPNVLNHMRIGGVQQVMLKATVMEVNRSKLRQFGMNFGLIGNESYLLSTPGPITPVEGLAVTGTSANVTFSGFSNTSVSFGFMDPNQIFQGFIDALRTEGLLKIHATPMVVTHNGQPAELLNGGEAPVLVPAGLGTTAIEFKPFGIILNAVPHILGNGRLRLQIEPSVVERDFANAVQVDGITVPSFTVRKVSTQVEMNFGETLVIGGLISKREDGSTAKLPFFGELPWIGALFSRKQYTEAETELVILVTPEYVAPMSPEQVPAGGPGKFTSTPTDHELIWHGLLEVPSVGPDCDAVFNCTECQQNGFCHRHPNGRWELGGGGSGCGPDGRGPGCTDGLAPGIQPRLIAPESGPADTMYIEPPQPAGDLPLPTTSQTPPNSASSVGYSRVLPEGDRFQEETDESTKPTPSLGRRLLAPLMR